MSQLRFRDRAAAGRALAPLLDRYANRTDVVVLALPRGGVPVAYGVARALEAPMDVFVVRKLGIPGHEELAVGAIASGGVQVVDDVLAARLGLLPETIDAIAEREAVEVARREAAYRDGEPREPIEGRAVLIVDDGIATGSTMRAALIAVRAARPATITVAVPVASPEAVRDLEPIADEVVVAHVVEELVAVGLWYEDFTQTPDEEVRALLVRARTAHRVKR